MMGFNRVAEKISYGSIASTIGTSVSFLIESLENMKEANVNHLLNESLTTINGLLQNHIGGSSIVDHQIDNGSQSPKIIVELIPSF